MVNSSITFHRKTEYCWWSGERCRGKGYSRNSCSKKCDYWGAGLERTTCVFLSADQLFGQCYQVSSQWVNDSWPLDAGQICLILLNHCVLGTWRVVMCLVHQKENVNLQQVLHHWVLEFTNKKQLIILSSHWEVTLHHSFFMTEFCWQAVGCYFFAE